MNRELEELLRRDAFSAADPELNDLLNLAVEIYAEGGNHDSAEYMMELLGKVEARLAARPAQTEQQPVRLPERIPQHCERGINDPGWNAALDEVARLNAAPIAQTAPQVPERLPVEPYQTVDRSSTNYKAGWNACRKSMLEGQAAPHSDK